MFSIDFVKLFKRAKFFEKPCPHWIISDFFADDILNLINSDFPSSKWIFNNLYFPKYKEPFNQNTSYDIQFSELDSLDSPINTFNTLSKAWSDQRLNILDYLSSLKALSNYDSRIFDISNSFSRGDIRTNSPVTKSKTTTIGPHLDNPKKILFGLIYLRDKYDDSNGGCFNLYKLKSNAPKKYCSYKRRVPLKFVEDFKEIPYGHNNAIFFLSNPLAIHGVSQRSITCFDRRLINLSIEFLKTNDINMFDINPYINPQLRENLFNRLLNKLLKKKSKFSIYDWQSIKDL